MTVNSSLIARIDAAIAGHAMLSHPFYQAWNEGKLDKAILQGYAKQYFAQVKAFPTYVSAVHAGSDDLALRRMLLENLNEEEGGEDNHPELWLRFAEGLGADRAEVESAELTGHTRESVARLRELTRSENTHEGLAALYAYESQIPAVARTKREGLKSFYDLDDERAVSFFSVHEVADEWHSQIEREALSELCNTPEKEAQAVAAAEAGAKALWHFLDGVTAELLPEDLQRELCAAEG